METNDVEIEALVGILIISGLYKFGQQNIFNLFDGSKRTRLESVHLTMNIQRFRFVL